MKVANRDIKGCKPSPRYQRYYSRINTLYFEGKLPPATIYTAPLLKISAYGQKELEENEELWLDPGEYGILGMDEEENWCIILDKETAIRHSILTKQTVIHECLHLYLQPYRGHGIKFTKLLRKIAAMGALDNLI